MTNKRIEVDDFSLQLTGDIKITITRDDLERVKRPGPRLAVAIASAFYSKHVKGDFERPKELALYPEVTSAIDHKDLARFEADVCHGMTLAERMKQFSLASKDVKSQNNYRNQISNSIHKLARIIEDKTDGAFTAGFRQGRIVIIDTRIKSCDLVFKGTVYKDIIPLRDYQASRKGKKPVKINAGYRGFPADVIITAAAAGDKGLPLAPEEEGYRLGEIDRFYKRSGIRAMLSDTNRYWFDRCHVRHLCLSIAGGENLRVLDFSDPDTLLRYKVEAKTPKNNRAYAFVVASLEAAGHAVSPIQRIPSRQALRFILESRPSS